MHWFSLLWLSGILKSLQSFFLYLRNILVYTDLSAPPAEKSTSPPGGDVILDNPHLADLERGLLPPSPVVGSPLPVRYNATEYSLVSPRPTTPALSAALLSQYVLHDARISLSESAQIMLFGQSWVSSSDSEASQNTETPGVAGGDYQRPAHEPVSAGRAWYQADADLSTATLVVPAADAETSEPNPKTVGSLNPEFSFPPHRSVPSPPALLPTRSSARPAAADEFSTDDERADSQWASESDVLFDRSSSYWQKRVSWAESSVYSTEDTETSIESDYELPSLSATKLLSSSSASAETPPPPVAMDDKKAPGTAEGPAERTRGSVQGQDARASRVPSFIPANLSSWPAPPDRKPHPPLPPSPVQRNLLLPSTAHLPLELEDPLQISAAVPVHSHSPASVDASPSTPPGLALDEYSCSPSGAEEDGDCLANAAPLSLPPSLSAPEPRYYEFYYEYYFCGDSSSAGSFSDDSSGWCGDAVTLDSVSGVPHRAEWSDTRSLGGGGGGNLDASLSPSYSSSLRSSWKARPLSLPVTQDDHLSTPEFLERYYFVSPDADDARFSTAMTETMTMMTPCSSTATVTPSLADSADLSCPAFCTASSTDDGGEEEEEECVKPTRTPERRYGKLMHGPEYDHIGVHANNDRRRNLSSGRPLHPSAAGAGAGAGAGVGVGAPDGSESDLESYLSCTSSFEHLSNSSSALAVSLPRRGLAAELLAAKLRGGGSKPRSGRERETTSADTALLTAVTIPVLAFPAPSAPALASASSTFTSTPTSTSTTTTPADPPSDPAPASAPASQTLTRAPPPPSNFRRLVVSHIHEFSPEKLVRFQYSPLFESYAGVVGGAASRSKGVKSSSSEEDEASGNGNGNVNGRPPAAPVGLDRLP